MAPAQTTTGPPDFVGVGTQRSGTTWWFETLLGHPQIRGPKTGAKEQHYFDRFCRRPLTDADIRRYHRKFPREPGQIAGEWTPRYMFDFWTPRVIARVAPEAKLLVMFRDPIERFRSGVPHRLSRTPDARLEAATADGIERGRYATQLERLHRYFPPERVLVLQYEQCRADPVANWRRTLRFLEVDESEEPPDFDRARGSTMAPKKVELWDDFNDGLRATFEPEVERLRALVPDLDVSLWPNFSYLAAVGATS